MEKETPEIKKYNPEEVKTYKPKEKSANGSHTQIYDIVTGRDPSWQGIIYELINSEQLNPWDIDLTLLCQGYFEKIQEMEEHDFFASSKILLAASFLLRIKSEILLNKHIKEIDEILFGKKEEDKKYILERIELEEGELPLLIPKSPLPRFKKVTLDELMGALETAIKTESRRITKEIEEKQRERLAYVDLPKVKRINIKDRIRQFYARVLASFNNPKHKSKIKLPYSEFTSNNKEAKITCFLPLLHLSNTERLWLEQDGHFDEIWIYMYKTFKKNFPEHDKELLELENELKEDLQEMTEELGQEKRKTLGKVAENPIGDFVSEEISDE